MSPREPWELEDNPGCGEGTDDVKRCELLRAPAMLKRQWVLVSCCSSTVGFVPREGINLLSLF